MGRPTSVERPITTARSPESAAPAARRSSITPAGVQGATASGAPWASRPAFTGCSPSTSFSERELEQDAVDGRLGVELREHRGQHLRGGVGRERVVKGEDPHLSGRLALSAHVKLGGRIVTYEDGGESRLYPVFGPQPPGLLAHALAHARCDSPPVYHPRLARRRRRHRLGPAARAAHRRLSGA